MGRRGGEYVWLGCVGQGAFKLVRVSVVFLLRARDGPRSRVLGRLRHATRGLYIDRECVVLLLSACARIWGRLKYCVLVTHTPPARVPRPVRSASRAARRMCAMGMPAACAHVPWRWVPPASVRAVWPRRDARRRSTHIGPVPRAAHPSDIGLVLSPVRTEPPISLQPRKTQYPQIEAHALYEIACAGLSRAPNQPAAAPQPIDATNSRAARAHAFAQSRPALFPQRGAGGPGVASQAEIYAPPPSASENSLRHAGVARR